MALQGYPAAATDRCSKPGRRCAVLWSEKSASRAPFGNLMQYFDAVPYRGKQVRFRASVRVEPAGSRGQLWLRVDRPNQQMGFFDNMGDRPISSPEWGAYEINGEVSEDAAGIALGVMLIGGEGTVYIDNVSFEVTGEVKPAPIAERSRPLTGRGLENLVAFARPAGGGLEGRARLGHPGTAGRARPPGLGLD